MAQDPKHSQTPKDRQDFNKGFDKTQQKGGQSQTGRTTTDKGTATWDKTDKTDKSGKL